MAYEWPQRAAAEPTRTWTVAARSQGASPVPTVAERANRSGVGVTAERRVPAEVRFNGAAISELDLNTMVAATYGDHVGLVTGDDELCRLAERSLPQARTVAVKTAFGVASALSLHPSRARTAVADAAREVVELRPQPIPAPKLNDFQLEAAFQYLEMAEVCGTRPGCGALRTHS